MQSDSLDQKQTSRFDGARQETRCTAGVATELDALEPSPDAMWNQLITRIHSAYTGSLTYDLNWSETSRCPVRPWTNDPGLDKISMREYSGMWAHQDVANQSATLSTDHVVQIWQTTPLPRLDQLHDGAFVIAAPGHSVSSGRSSDSDVAHLNGPFLLGLAQRRRHAEHRSTAGESCAGSPTRCLAQQIHRDTERLVLSRVYPAASCRRLLLGQRAETRVNNQG